jgi:hypothetical protein
MTAFFLIIYNYDLVLPYFYYEFLHSCPVISGYVLKNMCLGGFGYIFQKIPYFDLSVAYDGQMAYRVAAYVNKNPKFPRLLLKT